MPDQTHAELAAQFTALVPQIENFAGARFRHLGPEARQEAIQNTLALCWVRLVALSVQGKHRDEAVINSVIQWSILHTSQGRPAHGKGQSKAKCVLDYARRRLRDVRLTPEIQLQRHVSPECPVPTQAAFRLDTSAWLATLSDRDRRIALDLAEGYPTGEVARRHGVSPARISQLRRVFEESYRNFHGAAA